MCQEKDMLDPAPVFTEVFTESSPKSKKNITLKDFWSRKRRTFVALRERRCRDSLKKAYTSLQHCMHVPNGTRLTRHDTLRLAILYIAHLSELLAKDDERRIRRIRLALESTEMDCNVFQRESPMESSPAKSPSEWCKGLEFFWVQELMKGVVNESSTHL